VLATYTSILFALIYIDGIIVFYNQLGGCWFNSLVCHSINRYSLVIVETTHDTRIQSQLPNILKKFLIYLSSHELIDIKVTNIPMVFWFTVTMLLIYLFRTIKMWNIRNYIHCSGSHEIQIPTLTAADFASTGWGFDNYIFWAYLVLT